MICGLSKESHLSAQNIELSFLVYGFLETRFFSEFHSASIDPAKKTGEVTY